ncbi:MAG: hypothetical protein M3R55_03480 [Acidobacteriota bacterium]|nr:hypothetical protein [Acidobacteriota bacterium]
MKQPEDAEKREADAGAVKLRRWTVPAIVEYGHLAKLTRTGSGSMAETGGMRSCL